MKPERAVDYVGHIIEAIDRIASYTSGLDQEAYLRGTLVQDAVIRNFEIIGEAASNVERQAPDVAAAHPEIPWSFMRGMRNRLAHGYFNVDHVRIWVTLRDDLPPLRDQLEALRRELKNG